MDELIEKSTEYIDQNTKDLDLERFRLIADNIGDFVAVTDLNAVYIYVNPAHKKLGYDPEELIGKMGISLLPPSDIAHLQTSLKAYRAISLTGPTTICSIGRCGGLSEDFDRA